MNYELTHHGILGMKWGVRRTPEQLGHTTKYKYKRKHSSRLEDRDLAYAVGRTRLEEDYNDQRARQKERLFRTIRDASDTVSTVARTTMILKEVGQTAYSMFKKPEPKSKAQQILDTGKSYVDTYGSTLKTVLDLSGTTLKTIDFGRKLLPSKSKGSKSDD